MIQYSEKIKSSMIKKLITRPDLSAAALAQETGIPQQTLSRWLRESAIIKQQGVTMEAKRPKDWSALEKFNAVVDYVKLNLTEQGTFLRTRGLHSSHIENWRQDMLTTLAAPHKNKGKKDGKDIRIRELEKDLQDKNKALAEAATLMILKKKVQAFWGESEGN